MSGSVAGVRQRRMSFDSKRPLRLPSQVDQILWHTAVDGPGDHSLYGVFSTRGWATTGYVDNDGDAEQYLSTLRKPTGTRDADTRASTWETEDDGDPEKNAWNREQLAEIIRITVWHCREYNIPARLIVPDKRYRIDDARRWRQPGIGFHSLPGFVDPINKRGVISAKIWTKFAGKTCPGKTRTLQLINVVIPEVARQLGQPIVEPATPVEPVYSEQTIRRGDTGKGVKTLQHVLNQHGQQLVLDSDFGPLTEQAVKDVQAQMGVTVTGVWTPADAEASWRWRKANPVPVPAPTPEPDKFAELEAYAARADQHFKDANENLRLLRAGIEECRGAA